MATYFISDLHLDESLPNSDRLFTKFILDKAHAADAIYILGDLWEAWLGDDANSLFINNIKAQLNQISQKIPIYMLTGNRDFLLGKKFSQDINCNILPDPSIITLYGKKILISHGDIFCTADQAYQKYRKLVRNSLVQRVFTLLPFTIRKKIASYIRGKSQSKYATSMLNPRNNTLFDVNDDSIKALLQKNKISVLIHGHTHLPAINYVNIGGTKAKRIVLGAWEDAAYILKYTPSHAIILEMLKLT